jgi:hypothetical protein
LTYINIHTRNERELGDINNAYTEICNPLGGFIFPRLPYTINIRFSPVADTRNGFMHKPKESFYKCGLSCVAYKRGLWDVRYELLMSAQNEHKKIMEKRRIERSKVAVPLTSSTFTFDDGVTTRSLTALSEIITASREQRANTVNPQESFDRALQSMLSRRDNDE